MLTAISPIDGRYSRQTQVLSSCFSEFALIKYRIKVELAYFQQLHLHGVGDLKKLHQIPEELGNAIEHLTEEDAKKVKEIERTTNHDVKAVEYYLRDLFEKHGLQDYLEYIHFGLTSQDINNTAFPLMMKEAASQVMNPGLEKLIAGIRSLADKYPQLPMLAHTHGQPASPTTFKKEMFVFIERLELQYEQLKGMPFVAKFGGATGNFNAHKLTFPDVNWPEFADQFIQQLGLTRLKTTTQITHYDQEAAYFHQWIRINTILIDFCRDIWTYISMNYIKQKAIANEVGSSAMPHKVNPIDFENAEGNLMLANALLGFLAEKLPVSRLQRDLTDSTVLRNVGVPMAHILIAINSICKGLDKLSPDEHKITSDLSQNIAVIAEGIQSILRREGVAHPYELLKQFTRGKETLTMESFQQFIDELPVNKEVKAELRQLSPLTYIGYSM